MSMSLSVVLVLSALLIIGPRPAVALDRAADCPPGTLWNGAFCADVGDQPDDTVTGCSQGDPALINVPCEVDGFVFDAGADRYLLPLSPVQNERYRPPDGDLSHLGHWTGPDDQGWIFEWRKLAASWSLGSYAWGERGLMWMSEAPGEQPVVVVEPEEVARQILAGMRFEPLAIGLAPRAVEEDPASIGLVGAPVWMWVTNAGPATWGPVEESATAGGVTVTVTAGVESVTWAMGDGGRVTCEGPGVAYEARLGVRASPECGYVYEQTSGDRPGAAYEITATANWVVTWAASSGETGTLDGARPTTAARVRIGERQVIETC